MKNLILFLMVLCCRPAFASRPAPVGPPHHTTSRTALIRVHFSETTQADSLILYQTTGGVIRGTELADNVRAVSAAWQPGGWYIFRLQISSSGPAAGDYITLAKLKNRQERSDPASSSSIVTQYYLFTQFFMQGGDRVQVEAHLTDPKVKHPNEHSFTFQFSGPGAAKYRLRYQVDSLAYHSTIGGPLFRSDLSYDPHNCENRKIDTLLAFIAPHRQGLDAFALGELTSHAVFKAKAEEALLLHYQIKEKFQAADAETKARFLEAYLRQDSVRTLLIPLPVRLASPDFQHAAIRKAMIVATVKYGTAYKDSIYRVIIVRERGEMREKVLLLHLQENGKTLLNLQQEVEAASRYIQTPVYAAALLKLKRQFTGQPAYDFALPDTAGRMVRLSDFKGKTIFIDFWYTGCGNCLYFYEHELSKAEKEFEKDTSVVFISVCIDRNRRSWLSSVNSGRYTSPSIVNLYTNGQGISNDVIRYYGILAYPQPVIIGKDQRIFQFDTALRTQDGIDKAIEQLP